MRALEPYRIWLRYDDGVEGEVDLSDMAGDGVFVAWLDHSFFAGVHLGSVAGKSAVCPHARRLGCRGMRRMSRSPERSVGTIESRN